MWPYRCVLAVAFALGACAKTQDIHDTKEARDQPCVSCHGAAFATVVSPVHAGVFPQTCGSCHTTHGWSPAALPDHHWFVLDGQHASAPCAGCHTGDPPRYAGTPTDCAGCHLPSYTAATHPVHVSVLPDTCADCHSKDAWTPATVKEHPWFQLDGKHLSTPCVNCHTGDPKRFAGTPNTCVGCHLPSYTAATHPVHVSVLPDTCADCHSKDAWTPATVKEHPWFQLDGKHLSTPCASCHTGNPKRFAGTPNACVGCHLADYQGSTFPGHDKFPQTCRDCHNPASW